MLNYQRVAVFFQLYSPYKAIVTRVEELYHFFLSNDDFPSRWFIVLPVLNGYNFTVIPQYTVPINGFSLVLIFIKVILIVNFTRIFHYKPSILGKLHIHWFKAHLFATHGLPPWHPSSSIDESLHCGSFSCSGFQPINFQVLHKDMGKHGWNSGKPWFNYATTMVYWLLRW